MAMVPSSWPPAGCWWPPALDGGEVRHKIEQPRRAGCSRSLAEASSCSPADGSSYNEVANSCLPERGHGTAHLQEFDFNASRTASRALSTTAANGPTSMLATGVVGVDGCRRVG